MKRTIPLFALLGAQLAFGQPQRTAAPPHRSAPPPPQTTPAASTGTATWMGLTFGMTKDQAKAVLKMKNLKVVDTDNDHLEATGYIGAGIGVATLGFSSFHLARVGLQVVVLKFNYRADEAEAHPGLAALVSASHIAEKYLAGYGKPFFSQGEFPVSGPNDSHSQWMDELLKGEPWTSMVSWKWRDGGQEVDFSGSLILREAKITVIYSPDRPRDF